MNKKITLITLALLAVLATIASATALPLTEGHDLTQDANDGASSTAIGMTFIANKNISILGVTSMSSAGSTSATIYYENETAICSRTQVGTYVNFSDCNITFTSGSHFYIMFSGNMQYYRNSVNNNGAIINKTNVALAGACQETQNPDCSGYTGFDWAYVLESITTQEITTAPPTTPLREYVNQTDTWTDAGGYSQELGARITALKNITLKSVHYLGNDLTYAKLYSNNYSLLETSTEVGSNTINFTAGKWNFTQGESFVIVVGNGGYILSRWVQAFETNVTRTNVEFNKFCQAFFADNVDCYETGAGIAVYTLESITTQEITPAPPIECTQDSDCGFCEQCSAEICTQQTGTDTKNECDTSVTSCGTNNNYYTQRTGMCNAGTCNITTNPITTGNVCINATNYDVAPTQTINCGIWSNCTINETIADQYYVGYKDDYSQDCDPANWQQTGTTQNANQGYAFNQTGAFPTCTEEPRAPVSETYQENANQSTYSGCWGYNGHTSAYLHDGDYETYGFACYQDIGYADVNYTLPLNTTKAKWQARTYYGATTNITVPTACINYIENQIRIFYASAYDAQGNTYLSEQNTTITGSQTTALCKTPTGWQQILNDTSIGFYEEGIFFETQNSTPACTPDYTCSAFGSCNTSNILPCTTVSDLNTCGIPYNPSNYSDYDTTCTYNSAGYTNTYANTDIPKILIDVVAGIFAGLAGVALVVGIGFAITHINKRFKFIKMK